MSAFLSPLDVRWVDSGHWLLLSPLVYQSDAYGAITVPANFVTDFASVPRAPLAYWIAGNRGHRAAVVHDWLYTKPPLGMERETADRVFREALPLDGVPSEIVVLMFDAVRELGASHWRGKPDPRPERSRDGEVVEAP